jgi:hypothetical protein
LNTFSIYKNFINLDNYRTIHIELSLFPRYYNDNYRRIM